MPISLDKPEYKSSKTPDHLEKLVMKDFNVRPGEFVFIEVDQLTDDTLLITTRRSAFFSSDICEIYSLI